MFHHSIFLSLSLSVAFIAIPALGEDPADLKVQNHFEVGPNAGKANENIRAPIDVWWDEKARKLHARSLILTEMDDPVDLRLRRAPGKYPDGPIAGTSPSGTVSGLVCWDALTSAGWRQVAGIEGMAKDAPAPPPAPGSHPGWLTFWTYAENHDDRVRRVILDDTGAMSLGGGGFGGSGLPVPSYGFHLFGGGLRVQAVSVPGPPKLTVVGAAADQQYAYQIIARDSKGNETPAGAASVIDGPAALTADNYIRVEWDQCPGAETYFILRNGRRLDLVFRGEGTRKTLHDSGFADVGYEPARRNATADAEVDGALTVRQGLHTPGVCAPPQITADQHDYDPPGLADGSTLALDAAAPVKITGLKAPVADGRWMLLVNNGKNPVTLVNDGKESNERNRFRTGTGKDFTLRPDQMAVVIYTVQAWRFPSMSGD
jgi:hypothetical protein